MGKWLSMELTEAEWAGIRPILKRLKCKYETSACGALVHVEVYCDVNTAKSINDAIDNL